MSFLVLFNLAESTLNFRTRPRGPIEDAIQSGAAANYSREDCTWRRGNDRDLCPDPDIYIYLYTPGGGKRLLDPESSSDWLQHRDYEPTRDNIILIHGYAGNAFLVSLSLRIER